MKSSPDFTLPDQNGQLHSLAEYRGKKVLLYFYPKDDTPGCTVEACSFRDRLNELKAHGVQAYGVWVEKSMYGKKFMGTQRDSFLIDEGGKVVKHYEKVKPEGHVEAVLADVL